MRDGQEEDWWLFVPVHRKHCGIHILGGFFGAGAVLHCVHSMEEAGDGWHRLQTAFSCLLLMPVVC